MRFYKNQDHQFYAGVDLHARSMYVCILDQADDIVVHKNLRADPKLVFQTIKPYRDGLVVAAECMFAWYWLTDLLVTESYTAAALTMHFNAHIHATVNDGALPNASQSIP